MNCNDVQNLLSEYIDDFCTDIQNEEIKHHIETCKECADEYHMLQDMIDDLKQIDEVDPPESLHRSIMNRIDQLEENRKTISKITFKSFSLVAAVFLFIVVFAITRKYDFLSPIDRGGDNFKQESILVEEAPKARMANGSSDENSSIFMLEEEAEDDISAEADKIMGENVINNEESVSASGVEKDLETENSYDLLFGIASIAIIFLFTYVIRRKNR